jgi:hypothetical protein
MAEVDGELNLGVRRASLAREPSWVPAVENRGEGVLISFKPEAIKSWLQRPDVQKRGIQLLQGFQAWQQAHPAAKSNFPGLPYIMLHSLSHLLITAVSLDCGYSASSIRERIYAGDAGYGILLHTGTPDSEGTLGGLPGGPQDRTTPSQRPRVGSPLLERSGLCPAQSAKYSRRSISHGSCVPWVRADRRDVLRALQPVPGSFVGGGQCCQ